MITTDEYIDYDRRADEIFELINNGMTRDQVAKKFNYENIRSMDQLMRRRGYRIVKNKYVKANKEKPSICKLPLRTEKLMDALNKSVKDGTEISEANLNRWGFENRQQLNDHMKAEGVKFDPLNKRYYIVPKGMDDSAISHESDFGPCFANEKIAILKEENRREAEAKKRLADGENKAKASLQSNDGISSSLQTSAGSNGAIQTSFNNNGSVPSSVSTNGALQTSFNNNGSLQSSVSTSGAASSSLNNNGIIKPTVMSSGTIHSQFHGGGNVPSPAINNSSAGSQPSANAQMSTNVQTSTNAKMSSNAQPSQNPSYFSNKNNTRAVAGTYDTSGLGEQSDTPEKMEDFLPFIHFLYNNKNIFDYMVNLKNQGKPFTINIPGKCVQKTFHINYNLACLINRFADEHGMKYKQVIEAAVVEYLNKYGYGDDLYDIINR